MTLNQWNLTKWCSNYLKNWLWAIVINGVKKRECFKTNRPVAACHCHYFHFHTFCEVSWYHHLSLPTHRCMNNFINLFQVLHQMNKAKNNGEKTQEYINGSGKSQKQPLKNPKLFQICGRLMLSLFPKYMD